MLDIEFIKGTVFPVVACLSIANCVYTDLIITRRLYKIESTLFPLELDFEDKDCPE